MLIQPYNGFLTNTAQPAILLDWDFDDVVHGASSWSDRIAGVQIAVNNAIQKAADGLFVLSASALTVNGKMPTLSNNKCYVAAILGHTPTATAATPTCTIGTSDTGFFAMKTTGAPTSDGASLATAPTAAGVINSDVCEVGMADGTTEQTIAYLNRIERVTATPTTCAWGSADTTGSAQCSPGNSNGGTLGASLACNALTATTAGLRVKKILLCEFDGRPSRAELFWAAQHILLTKTVPPIWQNRAR